MFVSSGLRSGRGRPEPAPTPRKTAARPSTTASAATSAPRTDRRASCPVPLDVRYAVADERRDVAADEHGVPPGPFQLQDILPRRARQLGDCELARRDVGKQLENAVERRLLVLRAFGAQEKDLRIDVLEDALELV